MRNLYSHFCKLRAFNKLSLESGLPAAVGEPLPLSFENTMAKYKKWPLKEKLLKLSENK
jgi:hypothetical protein